MGELVSLTGLRQMDLQTMDYAPARAATLQRIQTAIEHWETSPRKYNDVGGSVDGKSKKNIPLKIIPKVVADPLVMPLQNYPTYAALKQHAMYKADLLVKFRSDTHNVANLAQRGDESDDGWPGGGSACNFRSEDAPDVVQQLLAVFKQFDNRNQTSSPPPSDAARPICVPRCLNCGSVGHDVSRCHQPGVPIDDRPCLGCGKQGHLARDCQSKPRSPKVAPRKPPAKRLPPRANNLETYPLKSSHGREG